MSTSECKHDYKETGTYRVSLYGEVPAMYGYHNKNFVPMIRCLKAVLIPNGYISPLKYGQYMFFGCENLVSLGVGVIGENMKNCRSLFHMFDGAKIKQIPENLLYYCENLIDASYIFEACDIEYLPDNLFKSCTKLKYLNHAFHRCDYLKEIPENFFDNCPEIENIEKSFQACRRLETVPSSLFDKCGKIKDARFAFAGENIVGGYLRKQESLTSDVPPLWERSDLPYGGVTDIGSEKWYKGYATGCVYASNFEDALSNGWAWELD